MANIEQNKETYISLLRSTNREGIENLISWIQNSEKSDFFTAPSSTIYHGNYLGGLCQHSLNVYYAAKQLLPMMKDLAIDKEKVDEITEENLIIAALLHDLCKTNFYIMTDKWYKDEHNAWQKYNGYKVEDKFPMGHGEKSVFMVQRFINLTGSEALAIRWHMGMADPAIFISPYMKNAFNDSLEKVPLVLLIAMADYIAAYIMETKVEVK